MYFIAALGYPFKSKGWASKVFVTFFLGMLPVLGIMVLAGYTLRIARDVLAGGTDMPEFDFGEDALKGFLVVIATIVYEVPFLYLSSRIQSHPYERATMSISGDMVLLLLIVGVISSLFLLIATVRYIVTDDFAVFVDFRGSLALMRRNVGTIILFGINSLMFTLVGLVLAMLGLVMCIIPGIIVWTMLIFGRAYMLARLADAMGLTLDPEKFKNEKPKNDFAV